MSFSGETTPVKRSNALMNILDNPSSIFWNVVALCLLPILLIVMMVVSLHRTRFAKHLARDSLRNGQSLVPHTIC